MNLINAGKKIAAKVTKFGSKHAPEILVALGLIGGAGALVAAVDATVNTIEDIHEAEEECGEKITGVELAKIALPNYIPTALIAISSGILIIGGTREGVRRNVALAAACAFSEQTLKDYQAKVVEKIGVKKESEIREEIAREQIRQTPRPAEMPGHRNGTVCYDPLAKQYFLATADEIRHAINEIGRMLLNERFVCWNDFTDFFGYYPANGDDLGWSVDDGIPYVQFTAVLDDDERPCLCLHYNQPPVAIYQREYV